MSVRLFLGWVPAYLVDQITVGATTKSEFPTPPCTGLEQILKNMHIVYLIFIGSYTDGCLGLTAADSISRGFLPTVRTTFTFKLTLRYFADAGKVTSAMRCVFASSAHNRHTGCR